MLFCVPCYLALSRHDADTGILTSVICTVVLLTRIRLLV